MIKMIELLGILTGGIIALLMGIWVSKKYKITLDK